jgi:hypothetical protein
MGFIERNLETAKLQTNYFWLLRHLQQIVCDELKNYPTNDLDYTKGPGIEPEEVIRCGTEIGRVVKRLKELKANVERLCKGCKGPLPRFSSPNRLYCSDRCGARVRRRRK